MPYLILFLIFVPVLAVVALLMTEKGSVLKEEIQFLTEGLDSGFSLGQILFLGKIAKATGLEHPASLYWSLQSLDRCTTEILRISRQTGTTNDSSTQKILSRLYAYRTKIELENAGKKHGVESTKDILVNQRVRILLRGTGLFTSKILKNTPKYMVLEYPSGGSIPATSIDWNRCNVSIYFWRHDDAGYVFDSVVVPDPVAPGRAVLHVAHSYTLVRSQKRKSVRVKCSIYAQMYLVKPGETLEDALEPEPGMKCLIEDLSEDGAMVIIGGKALKNMKIKLQFLVHDVLIVMAGMIRGVTYNSATNQSHIHFESNELNPRMKNAVLTFVYNILPEEEREVLDAIRLTEEDGLADAEVADVNVADVTDTAGESTKTAPKDSDSIDIDILEDLPPLPDFIVKK